MTDRDIIRESIDSWDIIREGLWDSIKRFFASGDPKDPHIRGLRSDMRNATALCRKMYPHSEQKISVPISSKVNDPEDPPKDKKLEIRSFKENPKQAVCVLEARYKFMTEIVNYYNKTPEEKICENHKYPDKCISFVREQKFNSSRTLNSIKSELEIIKKYGKPEKEREFSIVLKKVKDII